MRSIAFILLVSFLQFAYGQDVSRLNLKSFDADIVDSLVFEKVNEMRLEAGVAKIYQSNRLASQSSKHSAKMSDQNRISYSEERVGQCVLSIMLPLKSVENYQDLANLMVNKWMLSPGHKKLLLGEFFVYGGGGTVLKEKSQGHYILMSTFQVSYNE